MVGKRWVTSWRSARTLLWVSSDNCGVEERARGTLMPVQEPAVTCAVHVPASPWLESSRGNCMGFSALSLSHHVGGSSTSDKNSVRRMLFWSNVDGRRNSSFFWSLTSPVKFLAWKEITFFVSLIGKLSLLWEIHFFMLWWKVLRFACWKQNN